MLPPIESTKVFFDVLADYWDLKYIFEYGFYWDDRIMNLLLHKSSQTVRELLKTLADAVYDSCAVTPWWQHVSGGRGRKSQRKLIWNNHYSLISHPWFQTLYGCWGNVDAASDAYEYVRCCDQGPYTSCLDNAESERGCSYRRICRMDEMVETFCELAEGAVHETKKDIWMENPLHREIFREYCDVIDTKKGLRLRQNRWTREALTGEQQEVSTVLRPEAYDSFLEMIRFFAGFAPLSVLGINFLNHLSVDTGQFFALIRNLPGGYGLEQEYIYRIRYAMLHNRMIRYGDQEYVPVRICYLDRGILGLPMHPYLEAYPYENGECASERSLLPLYTGTYLEPAQAYRGSLPMAETNTESEEYTIYTVDFYYNARTDYLVDRRQKGWADCIIQCETLPEKVEFESPYYPGMRSWKTDRVTCQIRERDRQGFLLYIASFGEFARLVGASSGKDPEKTLPMEMIPVSGSTGTRGKIREYESLLSAYNSRMLMERIGETDSPGESPESRSMSTETKVPARTLPPREAELEWISFILDHYPNMCRIFLEEGDLEKISEQLVRNQTEIESACGKTARQKWFDPSAYDFSARVADVRKNEIAKYRRILQAIQGHQILCYEFGDRLVHILPYALEYDVTRHLAGEHRVPLDIMCYSLDEMRTIKIKYRDIVTRDACPQQAWVFRDTEKLYHVLAYGIRCACEDKEEVWTKAAEVFEACWKSSTRYSDNYTRCIKKRFRKKQNEWQQAAMQQEYEIRYRKTKESIQSQGGEEELLFYENLFGYYHRLAAGEQVREGMEVTDFQWKYQSFLLNAFIEGYQELQKVSGKERLGRALAQLSDADIWKLVSGSDLDGIENEIVFCNEKLQGAKVSFLLKDISQQNIDLIYRLFGNFICVGELREDGRLQFTVTYEAFYYRKIHMNLMALDSLVEEICPQSTAQIIAQRRNNKEILHNGK